MSQCGQLTFSSVLLSADLSLPRRVSALSISALSLCSWFRELWRLVTFSWSSSFSRCSCWELSWTCTSASCCCFRLCDSQSFAYQNGVWTFYTFTCTSTSVWLTSFSALLCFSSSESLSSKSSWARWRFWFWSVSLWFSFLLSDRASRVLSRRSWGHTHVFVHYTVRHLDLSEHNFALKLTLYFSPPLIFCLSHSPRHTVESCRQEFALFTVMTWQLLSKSRDLCHTCHVFVCSVSLKCSPKRRPESSPERLLEN